MTLDRYLASAQWREEPPDAGAVSGPVDVDRVAAALHDLGRPDLAAAVSDDDHPLEAAERAWWEMRRGR